MCRIATRSLSSTARTQPVIAVVTPADSPALKALPLDAPAEFLIGSTVPEFLEEYGDRLRETEALLWIPPADPQILRTLVGDGHVPRLKWAHGFYAGIDPIASFAVEHLVPANVPLSNGRGAFSSSLAEYALTAALHFVKQVPRCIENRRTRTWDKFVMGELQGLTMGLIGAGSIAQATAKLGKAFGMRTVALRRNARKADGDGAFDLVLGPYDGPILTAHKQALMEQCDVVVCTLPGTPETRHFVSSAEFAAMKPGAVFVSLGRGIAVDEAALDTALRTGRLGGAALDVFEVEPLPPSSPLWDAAHGERLLLTAHNADYTETYFHLGWDVWRSNLDAFNRGEAPVTPVDPVAGY